MQGIREEFEHISSENNFANRSARLINKTVNKSTHVKSVLAGSQRRDNSVNGIRNKKCFFFIPETDNEANDVYDVP